MNSFERCPFAIVLLISLIYAFALGFTTINNVYAAPVKRIIACCCAHDNSQQVFQSTDCHTSMQCSCHLQPLQLPSEEWNKIVSTVSILNFQSVFWRIPLKFFLIDVQQPITLNTHLDQQHLYELYSAYLE